MARFIKDRKSAKGQVPGSLVFIGKQKMDATIIQLIQYNSEFLTEENLESIEEAHEKIKPNCVNWINIYGIHDLEIIRTIGEKFNIPSLLLEDILNTDQRPRFHDDEEFDAFILKMLKHEDTTQEIHAEQLSIILGENYILTLQERKGDVFNPVRDRIRKSRGRIRFKNNDYLTYALMDTVVDNYTIIIEDLGLKIEELEDQIFLIQDDNIVSQIYRYKTDLNFLRKNIRPVKDLMIMLIKCESSNFQQNNIKYLKDLFELVMQSTETIELYNNLISDQLNIYNTNVSNRMNEVMKVLTIFASIFIPLTFVAGIYGMNFEYIPELGFKYSYLIFWIVVVLVTSGLLLYFKRKKWL